MWGTRNSSSLLNRSRKHQTSCCVCGEYVTMGSWPATVSDTRRGYEGVCLNCSGRGHTAADCQSPAICTACRRRQTLGCSVCGGIGHSATQCPSPLCRRCGSRGHYEADCLISGPMPVTYTLRLKHPGDDLGIVLGQNTPDAKMIVTNMREGGPGELAGMTLGMIVESIDGYRVPNTEVLYSVLHSIHAKRETTVQVEVSQPTDMRSAILAARDASVYEASLQPPTPVGHNEGFELAPSYSPDGNRRFAGSPPAIPKNPSANPLNELSRRSPKFT